MKYLLELFLLWRAVLVLLVERHCLNNQTACPQFIQHTKLSKIQVNARGTGLACISASISQTAAPGYLLPCIHPPEDTQYDSAYASA